MEDSNDFYWNRKVYIISGNCLIIVGKEIWAVQSSFEFINFVLYWECTVIGFFFN